MQKVICNIDEEMAKLIAAEAAKPIRSEIKKAVKEYMENEYEEFLDIGDTARMLGCSPGSLYKTKDTILQGVYTYYGKSLRFPKFKLMRMMKAGLFRSENI